jgi:flagellar basal body-associated protein FliL
MKRFGLVILVVGLFGILGSMAMDTTVASLGGGRIHNIGLLNEKQGLLTVFGVLMIVGALLSGFAMHKDQPEKSIVLIPKDSGQTLRNCPFCAEKIQAAAIICKHCQRDVASSKVQEPQFGESISKSATATTASSLAERMNKQIAWTLVSTIFVGAVLTYFIFGFIKKPESTYLVKTPESTYLVKIPESTGLSFELETIVVNLADPNDEKVAQIGITLVAPDIQRARQLKNELPRIRAHILIALTQQTSTNVLRPEWKKAFADDVKKASENLSGVYLRSFIVQ